MVFRLPTIRYTTHDHANDEQNINLRDQRSKKTRKVEIPSPNWTTCKKRPGHSFWS